MRLMQYVSLGGGFLLLFAAIILLFNLFFNISTLGTSLTNLPTIAALITSAVAIFFYKKSNKFQLLGFLLFCIGIFMLLTNFSKDANIVKNGLFFFFIGLSLIASIIKIPHRYHFMQIIALTLLLINLFTFLMNLYHFVSSETQFGSSFWESIIFFILCQSILFIKPNRGFVGLFMTASRSSQLARMSLMYSLTLPLCLGFIFLIMEKMNFFSTEGRLAFLVIVAIFFSIVVTWMNVRLLYNSEVEHFMMKEALRINKISLELNANDLSSKVNQLEDAKKQISDKFNNQQTLVDIMNSS